MTRSTVVALFIAVLVAAQAVLADGLPEVLERHLDAFVSVRMSAWDHAGAVAP